MWRRLGIAWRYLLGRDDVHMYEGEEFVDLDKLTGRSAYELSAELMRRMLGSITLDRPEPLPAGEEAQAREQHNQTVAAFFPTILEPTIKRLIVAQEELMARGSAEMRQVVGQEKEQILFCRGSVNGLMLILEEFQTAANEHTADVEKRQDTEFDKHEMFPKP